MSKPDVRHAEEWTVTIEREETDDWPDLQAGRPYKPYMWRPEGIRFHLRRGQDDFSVTAIGHKYKNDGTVGQQPAHDTWYNRQSLPEWLITEVEHARRVLDLGPGRTGVPW